MGYVLVDPQLFCFLTLSGINSFHPFKMSERTDRKEAFEKPNLKDT